MRKFHCLLFVLKRSFICYYIIYMTVPLITFTLDYLGYWLSCQLFEKCWCLAFCKCTLLFCARHEKHVKNNSYKFLFYYSFLHVKKCYSKLFTVVKQQISHPDLTSTITFITLTVKLDGNTLSQNRLQIFFVLSVIFDSHSFNKISSLLFLKILLHNQSFSKLWIMPLLQ